MFKPEERKKRKVDLLVISDLHLGTYGCRAKELLLYLRSIKPKTVVLNGDIIDIWQFSKRYWPKSHMQVVQQILKWSSKDIPVYYLTGNHDEMLRKFSGFKMGNLRIQNKLVLNLNGKRTWIFHGDVFDVTMQHSKWLTRLGSHGYDLLILINAFCNFISERILKRGRISFSKRIKNSVKSAVSFINNFENVCVDIAIDNQYETVVCGHIHQPEMKNIVTDKGEVLYLNSGDWVESLTSLEYHKGEWKLYNFKDDMELQNIAAEREEIEMASLKSKELFDLLITEMKSNTPNEIVSIR